MKNKILTTLLLGIFLMSFASAGENFLGSVKQGECIEIPQVCASCSYVNITIFYPNKTRAVTNVGMTPVGSGTWIYDFCDTENLNRHDITGEGDINGVATGFDVLYFMSTPNGTEIKTQEAIIYIILATGVFILFAISFYFLIRTEYTNVVNEKGAVIKITKGKYVKIALVLLTWVLFTWFLNILIGLSDNFVSLTMYYGFFGFIFQTMNNLAIPLGIGCIILGFFEIIRDSNLQENIKKLGSAMR